MRLVADKQILLNPALAEKIIDFQIVEVACNRMIGSLLNDLASLD